MGWVEGLKPPRGRDQPRRMMAGNSDWEGQASGPGRRDVVGGRKAGQWKVEHRIFMGFPCRWLGTSLLSDPDLAA